MKTFNKIYKFEKAGTNLQNIEIEKILNSFDKFSRRILKSKKMTVTTPKRVRNP